MPKPFPCRIAALVLPLALAGCGDLLADADSGYRQPVTNASNGQPESPGSLPRGAGGYGAPPALATLSGGRVTTR